MIAIVLQNISMAALITGMTVMGVLFIVISVFLHRKADQMPSTGSL
jgi:hypothetical protein